MCVYIHTHTYIYNIYDKYKHDSYYNKISKHRCIKY